MGYVPTYQDLGATIEVTGDANTLAIAKLQLAINRMIRGGRADSSLFGAGDPRGPAAKAATMVKEQGFLGPVTAAAYASARVISGVLDPVTLTTMSQVDQATRALNAVADARGYGAPDKVALRAGLIPTFDSAKELSTTKLVLGAAAVLGIGYALWRSTR